MADEIVDQKARQDSAVLTSRLEGHEKVCGERYSDIKDSFGRVHGRLDGIGSGIRWILVACVSFLVSVIGTLLYYGPPWVAGG